MLFLSQNVSAYLFFLEKHRSMFSHLNSMQIVPLFTCPKPKHCRDATSSKGIGVWVNNQLVFCHAARRGDVLEREPFKPDVVKLRIHTTTMLMLNKSTFGDVKC